MKKLLCTICVILGVLFLIGLCVPDFDFDDPEVQEHIKIINIYEDALKEIGAEKTIEHERSLNPEDYYNLLKSLYPGLLYNMVDEIYKQIGTDNAYMFDFSSFKEDVGQCTVVYFNAMSNKHDYVKIPASYMIVNIIMQCMESTGWNDTIQELYRSNKADDLLK